MAGNSKDKQDMLSILTNLIICGENEVENHVKNLIFLNFDFFEVSVIKPSLKGKK